MHGPTILQMKKSCNWPSPCMTQFGITNVTWFGSAWVKERVVDNLLEAPHPSSNPHKEEIVQRKLSKVLFSLPFGVDPTCECHLEYHMCGCDGCASSIEMGFRVRREVLHVIWKISLVWSLNLLERVNLLEVLLVRII